MTSWFFLFLDLTEGPKPLANTVHFLFPHLQFTFVQIAQEHRTSPSALALHSGVSNSLCTGFSVPWTSPYMVQSEHISFRVRTQITSPHHEKETPEQLSSCFLCSELVQFLYPAFLTSIYLLPRLNKSLQSCQAHMSCCK